MYVIDARFGTGRGSGRSAHSPNYSYYSRGVSTRPFFDFDRGIPSSCPEDRTAAVVQTNLLQVNFRPGRGITIHPRSCFDPSIAVGCRRTRNPTMSIARCVSKIMDRIAPLSLAETWDNVSSCLFPPEHSSPLTVVRRQVGLLLGPPRPSRLILTTRG